MEPSELVAAIEAVIFVSSDPITLPRLKEAFPEESEQSLADALERLARLFETPGRGLLLDRVAGGFRIATRSEVHPHVARFIQQERAERLSMRTLETLSVVAYKQPVTAAEIQEIRGVDPTGTLKTLLDRGLVRIAGRKKVVGRPFVYGTTTTFLTTFGLNDLSELPTLRELEDFATDVVTTDPAEVEPEGETEAAPVAASVAEEPPVEAAATAEGPDASETGGRGRSRRKR